MAGVFPPDQDLPPDAISVATVIGPNRPPKVAGDICQGLRGPAGRGRPFAEGLRDALRMHNQLLAERGLDGG